jgi:hypothetical protein
MGWGLQNNNLLEKRIDWEGFCAELNSMLRGRLQ